MTRRGERAPPGPFARSTARLAGVALAAASLSAAGVARADVVPPASPPAASIRPDPGSLDPVAAAGWSLRARTTEPAPTPRPPPVAAAPLGPAPRLTPQLPSRRWALPAAARLGREGLWPSPIGDLDAPATRGELFQIASAVALRAGAPVPDHWAPRGALERPVTAGEADRVLVRAMGLDAERRSLAHLATADGRRFALPPGFPSEVLAREAGLRHNYPAGEERLERAPGQDVARADLAGMGAAALAVASHPAFRERLAAYADIQLPAMDEVTFVRIQRALSQVGQPYVWGGEWPTAGSPAGPQARGGFDCSGLVWFAFRAGRAEAELGALGGGLGRTTADALAWGGGAPRVALTALRPGDLVFFGPHGRRSRPGTIDHVAIVAGAGWMVQATGTRDGVSLTRVAAYWPRGLALARRPRGG